MYGRQGRALGLAAGLQGERLLPSCRFEPVVVEQPLLLHLELLVVHVVMRVSGQRSALLGRKD